MTIAPTLESARLILRAHTLQDFDASAAMWADPEVARYISGKPSSREETWSRMLRYAGHWQMLGFGYWVVEDKQTSEFLGEVGFADYKRELQPSIEGEAEAGWVMRTEAQGRGRGEEAVRCMLQWADANITDRSVVCIVAPEHQASVKLAHKVGFENLATTSYHGNPTLLLSRPINTPG